MKVGLASATTLDSNYTINDTTVTVASTAGWPSDTGVTFAIDVIDSQGVQVPGTYNEYVGTVATGTSISNVDWADGNADRNYTAGATTRVYIPVSKTRENRIVTWGLTEHDQDGTHGAVTATSLATNTISEGTAASGVTIDGVLLKDNKVATAGAVENTAVMLGMPVQVVSTGYTATATGTTTIPFDDTIPQNTEGTEFMTQAITPKSTTNILVIRAVFYCSYSIAQHLIAALFQDSTANALAVSSEYQNTPGGINAVVITHTMVAGTTSATTFKVRGGGNSAGTMYFNGASTGRLFGATTKSSITITEYKAS